MEELTKAYEYLKFIESLKNEYERGIGSLKVGKNGVTLPLDSVDISARTCGRVVEVTVTQVFKNPYSEHLEAEYVFPLAGCASVNSFKMLVGGRTVTGTIQERRAAREQYAKALNEGKRASLLEQERDDVFTMQVGNIPPAEKITVEVTYIEKLQFFEDGTTELRLPLVVAPRYIPGKAVAREQVGDGVLNDTNEVPDASRISPPRLAEGVNSDVSLSISVELTAELLPDREGQSCQIADLSCSQHAVSTRTVDGAMLVTLARANEILNRDFVLRWRLVTKKIASSVVLYKEPFPSAQSAENSGQRGSTKKGKSCTAYAMLSLMPPSTNDIPASPRDVIFVVDRSGSMSGQKMASAAKACSIMLSSLGPNDRFAITVFDDVMEWFEKTQGRNTDCFVQADEAGIESGIKYLKGVTARGGTELAPALTETLKLTRKTQEAGRVPVVVILTDGQVGNEANIFKLAQKNSGDTRIFTIGIDSAVNGAFLQRLASLAGGTSALVDPGAQLEDALVQISREVGAPLVTDLVIENLTDGVTVEALAPARLPDLFERRGSDCLFRIQLPSQTVIPRFLIKGRFADGREFRQQISAKVVKLEAVPRLWAREYIKELEDEFRISHSEELKKQIVDISLQFSVLTKFTAFVAVDEAEVVNTTGEVRQVVQPLHLPDQWQTAQNMNIGCFSQSSALFGGGIHNSFFDQSVSWGVSSSTPGSAGGLFQQSPDCEGGDLGACTGSWAPHPVDQSSNLGAPSAPPPAEPVPKAEWGFTIQPRMKGSAGDNSLLSRPRQPEPSNQSTSWDKWKAYSGSNNGGNHAKPNEAGEPAVWSAMKKLMGCGSNNPPQTTPPTSPISRISKALATFRQLWQQAWKEICAGSVPDAAPIEAARKELMQALCDHPIGFELPLLQKHLRLSAKEFVAALQTANVTAEAIFRMRSKLTHEYENALIEADSAMSQVKGRQGAFWESTV